MSSLIAIAYCVCPGILQHAGLIPSVLKCLIVLGVGAIFIPLAIRRK